MQGYIEFLLFVLGMKAVAANNSVQFLSKPYGQLSTSSTLRWVHAENGAIPIHAVAGASRFHHPEGHRNVYICRALHLAEWIPGQLEEGNKTCVVSLLGNVNAYRTYEVLQNVDNGSRLAWSYWDSYHPSPPGMIAGSTKFYIARKKIAADQEENEVSGTLRSLRGYTHYVGKFNPERFGRIYVITEDNEEKDLTNGEILVETEPIHYELNNVKFNMARKKIRREKKALAMTILRNTVDTTMEVDSALEYNFTYTSYWGQGTAILRGLRTLIRNNTGKMLADINWGMEENQYKRDVFRVATILEPGTAINITLFGNETKSEFPYTGVLVSFYKDGYKTERNIDGTWKVVDLKDVRPIFGPVYFITNNSVVPTMSTTTMVSSTSSSSSSSSSTTSTSTTSTTIRSTNTGYMSEEPQPSTLRQNNTVLTKSSVQSNDMLSDDGALTLESKNKEEIGDVHSDSENSATRTSLSALVIFPMLYVVRKIS